MPLDTLIAVVRQDSQGMAAFVRVKVAHVRYIFNSYMTQGLSGHFSSLGLVFFVLKGLFTRREGNPRARVALARGLP